MCFMAPLALTGPVYGFPSNRKSFHLGGRDGQNQQQCHSFCWSSSISTSSSMRCKNNIFFAVSYPSLEIIRSCQFCRYVKNPSDKSGSLSRALKVRIHFIIAQYLFKSTLSVSNVPFRKMPKMLFLWLDRRVRVHLIFISHDGEFKNT